MQPDKLPDAVPSRHSPDDLQKPHIDPPTHDPHDSEASHVVLVVFVAAATPVGSVATKHTARSASATMVLLRWLNIVF